MSADNLNIVTYRPFGPKAADHPSCGQLCPACYKPMEEGCYTTLVPLGPGDDEENRRLAREGKPFDAVAVEVHWACGTGRLDEEAVNYYRPDDQGTGSRMTDRWWEYMDEDQVPEFTQADVIYHDPNRGFPTEEAEHHPCRVYWGSHACNRPRGHKGHHWCSCCEDPEHHVEHAEEEGCAGTWPYYGPTTRFFGEDVDRQVVVEIRPGVSNR